MASDIIGVRMTPARVAQVEALEQLTGLQGPAAVIDFALATTLAQYMAQEEAGTMDKRVEVVKREMFNEDGHGYGTQYVVFCKREKEALDWVRENLDGEDGTPYYQDRGLWDQVVVDIVSVYDKGGSIRREFDGWRELLMAFADKEIGPAVLKRIAGIFS